MRESENKKQSMALSKLEKNDKSSHRCESSQFHKGSDLYKAEFTLVSILNNSQHLLRKKLLLDKRLEKLTNLYLEMTVLERKMCLIKTRTFKKDC